MMKRIFGFVFLRGCRRSRPDRSETDGDDRRQRRRRA
jgi:hypothetical protein